MALIMSAPASRTARTTSLLESLDEVLAHVGRARTVEDARAIYEHGTHDRASWAHYLAEVDRIRAHRG